MQFPLKQNDLQSLKKNPDVLAMILTFVAENSFTSHVYKSKFRHSKRIHMENYICLQRRQILHKYPHLPILHEIGFISYYLHIYQYYA